MPKKKVVAEQVKEPSKSFSPEEVEAALQITHSEYFMQVMALQSHLKDVEFLTYSKCPVTTPDGGTYLVSILHIEGPRINLKKLGEAADAQIKEKPTS